MLKRLANALKINKDHLPSAVNVKEFRYPSPGSQEIYKEPKGESSDIADNYYYKRDSRKHSPQILHVTKQSLLSSGEAPVAPLDNVVVPVSYKSHVYTVSPNQPPRDKNDYYPIVNYD